MVQIGLSSGKLKEIENKVLNDLREKASPPIIATCEEIPVLDDRRILVIIIPATGHAHSYRIDGKDASTYYIRNGRETREAKNGILRELLVKKNQLEPWDRRTNLYGKIDDLDLLSLREYLKQMGLWDNNKSLEDYVSATERLSIFVPPLAGQEQLTGELKPRNFSILLFSKEPLSFVPGAFTIVSIYKGTDRSEPTAERHQIAGDVVEQSRRAIQILNTEAYTAFDKQDNLPNQLKYPLRALQEAVINCIVHRDYESDQPTRITVFSDRIELHSPGGLPRAIDQEKFIKGKATPYWRNQSLAYFFNKMQLAQAEGQGIPTIIRTMKEEGCPDPTFELTEESVTCILPAHPRHTLIKNLHEIENDIIIGKHEVAKQRTLEILNTDKYNYRAIDLLCEISTVTKNPTLLLDFITESNIVLENLNPSTLINIADVLTQVKENPKVLEIASALSKLGNAVSLQEREIEKAAIALKRLHKDEELIQYVQTAISQRPTLANNVTLLQNKARASMDLAKICMDTARNRNGSPKIKAKAWERARVYLDESEKDLRVALDHVSSVIDKEYLNKDLSFLHTLKKIAQRPSGRNRRY